MPNTTPVKTCEFQNHHMDSTRWNDFEFRADDIVIATWAKSGTTWAQQIVGQLLYDGAEDVPIMTLCPWIEQRGVPLDKVLAQLAQQTHRRFLKTHLPVESLVMSDAARYVFIGRDGRDALWSWYNHHSGYTDIIYDLFNNAPGLVGPPLERPGDDIVAYFHAWLDGDGFPAWPFFSNIQSWWDIRAQPNVMLLHFNDMKADLAGSMRRIATFLDIAVDTERWPAMVDHCTFDYMQARAETIMPNLSKGMLGGGKRFIYKGTNGRWRDILSAADIAKYEAIAAQSLSPECALWLAGDAPSDSKMQI
mgnify:CR=1 FL=1|jgi:aryl sulfotransferase